MMNSIPSFKEQEMQERARSFLKRRISECQFCEGRGYILSKEKGLFKDCNECVGNFYVLKPFIMANIPIEYTKIELQDVEKTYESHCFENYLKLFEFKEKILSSTGILFYRASDHHSWGVTTAGILYLKNLIEGGRESSLVSASSFFDTFYTFGDDKESNKRKEVLLQFYNEVDVLLIDGLGEEFMKKEQRDSFIGNKFVSLLNSRKISGKFTILCSNLTIEEFSGRYGGIIHSFIKEAYLPFCISSRPGTKKKISVNILMKKVPELDGVFTDISDIKPKSQKPDEPSTPRPKKVLKKVKGRSNILDQM
jgi:hypothetical protein